MQGTSRCRYPDASKKQDCSSIQSIGLVLMLPLTTKKHAALECIRSRGVLPGGVLQPLCKQPVAQWLPESA